MLYTISNFTLKGLIKVERAAGSSIRNKLRASRKKLKEELIIMVQDGFQEHKLTPEFTERVSGKINSLIGMLGIEQQNLAIEFLAVGNSAVPALIYLSTR